MTVTIPDVMRRVRNHFIIERIAQDWQVQQGGITPAHFRPGEWIAIADGPLAGVHQLDEHGALPGAADAAWRGCIFRLEPPEGFLRLCAEIARWAQAHPDPAAASERFGEYSRSQRTADWAQAFASQLAPYVRMYPEVTL